MKKLFLILLSVLIGGLSLSAQEQKVTETDSIALYSTALTTLNTIALGTIVDDIGKYRLYPTENMWTFLKLNTQTGQVYQLQFSVKDTNYGEVVVNNRKLNYEETDRNGRYELYPTQNMYNFLMLDKNTGAVWQVQWSMSAGNRGIIRISDYED